ncbi:hypothetical protein HK405_001200, partial [Cladochytrium tenue]
MHAWLSLDDANVAVVHCTNGVGRTGTAIACYLRYANIFEDASDAFNHFVRRRTPDDESWVGVSHRRYVQYFNNVILLNGGLPSPYPLQLHRVILNTVPDFDNNGSCNPGLEIYQNGRLVYSSVQAQRQILAPATPGAEDEVVNISATRIAFRIPRAVAPLLLEKDIQLRIFHRPSIDESQTQVVTMINFSFHAGFMPSGLIRVAPGDLELARRDVDEGRFHEDLSVDLVFTEVVSQADLDAGIDRGFKPVSYAKFLDTALSRCLARLVSYHAVKVDDESMRTLEGMGISRTL